MRGVHSAVDEIRRNVFTEVARLAYEGGDLKRVDMIPYTIVPGEVARHRHDVFLLRGIIAPSHRSEDFGRSALKRYVKMREYIRKSRKPFRKISAH